MFLGKNKIILLPLLSVIMLAMFFGGAFAQTTPSRQIDVSAYIMGGDDSELDNGRYSVRFAIYSRNRETVDPYPSNSDPKIWEETQEVEINNGILNAYLGANTSLPESLDFSSNSYYLGIRIGTDSEMTPRKKIAAIPLAINAFSLQGATPGTKEGNILQLGKGGVIEESIIPELTALGTVETGAWEADPIESDFISDALSGKTYNGLTFTSNADGFSIAGGSISRELTLTGGDVILNAPGTVGSIAYSNGTGYAFSAAGTAGQVLLSGGSGAPTWGSAAGLSQWINDAAGIHYSAGNVGIGTDADVGYILKVGEGDVLFSQSDGSSGKINLGTNGRMYLESFNISDVKGSEVDAYDGSVEMWAYDTTIYGGSAGMYIKADSNNTRTFNFEASSPIDGSGQVSTFNFNPSYNNLNTAGDGYTALKLNVTDTISANVTQKYLMDLQTDGVSKFRIDSTGHLVGTIINSSSTAYNMFVGEGAGSANTTGVRNVFTGYRAGYSNTASRGNTANGYLALYAHVSGNYNTALGAYALNDHVNGEQNTAVGDSALYANINGSNNVAVGDSAGARVLGSNSTMLGNSINGGYGSNLLFIGAESGYSNFYGTGDTGIGYQSLYSLNPSNSGTGAITAFADSAIESGAKTTITSVGHGLSNGQELVVNGTTNYNGVWTISNATVNTFDIALAFVANDATGSWYILTATNNTALGYQAGYSNVDGTRNVFLGQGAGYSNISGSFSTLIGTEAGIWGTGGENVIIGDGAGTGVNGLSTYSQNILIGNAAGSALTTGSGNTIIGYLAGSSDTNSGGNIFLGYMAGFSETGSNKLYIENSDSATPLIYGDFYNDTLAFNANVGIGTMAPSNLLDLEKAGTAKAGTDLLEITNSGNAVDMDATLSSILFNQWYYDAITPAVADSGKITFGTETDWTSTASTQDSYLSFSTALDGTVSEKMRITSGGNVGIGDTTPDNLLEIMSSGAANTQFTISNTNAGDYNPQIGFELADGTNLFTMGIDDSDSDKFKIYSGTSISGTSEFTIDSTGLVSIANLEMGAQVFADDSGAISWIDMGVTSGATIGTVESYSAQLDGNPMLTMYGESDGAGGTQNRRVGIGTTTPSATLHVDGAATELWIEDDNLPIIKLYDDSVYEGYISTNGSSMYVKSVTGNLYLGTLNSASDIQILGASGNVGIGISPTARLHLDGVAGTVSFEVNSNETTAGSNVLALRSDVAGADDLIFRVQADGAVFADGAYTGTGADYAEYFETSDTDLESGEAVCLDPEKENAVKRCVRTGDNNLMGVVSSNPSIVGNSADGRDKDSRYKIVAMLGQIQGRISSENGIVQIGDSLTSAIIPGYLRKADPGESTVGVALQNFSGEQGSIQILISRKNKSLTVEKVEEAVSQRIAEMDVQDQVDSLIAEARTGLDEAMLALSSGIDARILNLTAIIEAQMDEIRADNRANLNAILQNSTDINILTAQVASILGDDPTSISSRIESLEILSQLSSRNLENGGIEITIIDPAAPTIGESAIPAGESLIMVNTKAVTADSKVYITPIGSTDNQVIYVGAVEEASGFEVKVDRITEVVSVVEVDGVDTPVSTPVVPKEIMFDWWIVEAR